MEGLRRCLEKILTLTITLTITLTLTLTLILGLRRCLEKIGLKSMNPARLAREIDPDLDPALPDADLKLSFEAFSVAMVDPRQDIREGSIGAHEHVHVHVHVGVVGGEKRLLPLFQRQMMEMREAN